jgi:hypothetical protein
MMINAINAINARSQYPGKASHIVLAAAFITIAPGIANYRTGPSTKHNGVTKQIRTGSFKTNICLILKKGSERRSKIKITITL